MTEKQLWEYIDEASKKGSIYGLESIRILLERMGNPEKDLKFIHISGTNGKGSTLSFIASILMASGYRVGTFSSPSVFDYREKIQVNGRNISLKALQDGFDNIKNIVQDIQNDKKPEPTLFEMETALAFDYFKKKKCDFVILECGLGGRDDATNIIPAPILSVFARISRDHMHILGETIAEIATVKSGIIKTGAAVVSCLQEKEAADVLINVAREKKCDISISEAVADIKYHKNDCQFNYKDIKGIRISLKGSYQPQNAATAIDAAKMLQTLGYKITVENIKKGLKETLWPGRFETICKKPEFIIDGAHNEEAALELSKSMQIYLADKPVVCICGVLADKEYEKVMAMTVDKASYVITITPPNNSRALDKNVLAETVLKYNKNVTTADSVEEAAEMAFLLSEKMNYDCYILAFGSLSFLGRLKKYVVSGKVSKSL